jgi:hypothetical protein
MWRSRKAKSREKDVHKHRDCIVRSRPECDCNNQVVQDGACCSLWDRSYRLVEEQLV